jgi:hypothetical protein
VTLPATFGQRFTQEAPASLAGDVGARNKNAGDIKQVYYKAFIVCSEQRLTVDAWLPETLAVDIAADYDAPYAQGLSAMAPNLGSLAKFMGMNLTTQAMTAQIWQGGAFINFTIPFIFQAETSAETEVMRPIRDLMKLTMPKDETPGGGGILSAPGPHIDIKKLVSNLSAVGIEGVSDLFQGVTGLAMNASNMIDTFKKLAQHPGDTYTNLLGGLNNVSQRLSSALVSSVVNNITLQLGQFLYFPSVVITDVVPTFNTVLNRDGKPTRAEVNVNFRTFFVPTDKDIQYMFLKMDVDDQRGITSFL